ncbi:unnamed protein product [Linum tenue]|uniref:Cytochrome P450 n=1 Tax=Linum tenue TaxID=586396 RepID=A0AAV0GP58_9ROSI|nr:unnamed protein product [Linum tenue]
MEQVYEILLSNKPPLPLIIILITILIILFSTIYILKKQNKKQSNKNRASSFPLPPGPWKLPIIGNIHQLAFSSALIHRRLAELAEQYGPSLRPIRDEEIGKLVKLIGGEPAGGAVNLHQLLVAVGNAMTSRTAFGKVRELESSFLPVARQILRAVGGFNIGDIFPSNR